MSSRVRDTHAQDDDDGDGIRQLPGFTFALQLHTLAYVRDVFSFVTRMPALLYCIARKWLALLHAHFAARPRSTRALSLRARFFERVSLSAFLTRAIHIAHPRAKKGRAIFHSTPLFCTKTQPSCTSTKFPDRVHNPVKSP